MRNGRIVASVLAALLVVLLTEPPTVNAKVDVPKLMHVQKTLKALDYSCHCTGKMDAATVEAIQLFQKDHGLKVDGQLTPETVSAIEKAWEDKVNKAEQEAAGQ